MKKMETIVPIENLVQEVKAASNSSKAVNQTKPVHVGATIFSATIRHVATLDKKKTIHSIKVGLALAVVSLLFVVQPLYEQAGDNAMWAIMTVVVIFEFSAGIMHRSVYTITNYYLRIIPIIKDKSNFIDKFKILVTDLSSLIFLLSAMAGSVH